MDRKELTKQGRQCMEALRHLQQKKLQSINDKIVQLDFDKAILEKELQIMLLEKDIRSLEAEKQEIEKQLV